MNAHAQARKVLDVALAEYNANVDHSARLALIPEAQLFNGLGGSRPAPPGGNQSRSGRGRSVAAKVRAANNSIAGSDAMEIDGKQSRQKKSSAKSNLKVLFRDGTFGKIGATSSIVDIHPSVMGGDLGHSFLNELGAKDPDLGCLFPRPSGFSFETAPVGVMQVGWAWAQFCLPQLRSFEDLLPEIESSVGVSYGVAKMTYGYWTGALTAALTSPKKQPGANVVWAYGAVRILSAMHSQMCAILQAYFKSDTSTPFEGRFLQLAKAIEEALKKKYAIQGSKAVRDTFAAVWTANAALGQAGLNALNNFEVEPIALGEHAGSHNLVAIPVNVVDFGRFLTELSKINSDLRGN